MRWQTKLLLAVLLIVVVGGGYRIWWITNATHSVTRYNKPPDRDKLDLKDDKVSDKNPVFDETLVDSRPLGDWEINKSAAVIRLDCPMLKPDVDADLLVLRASYTAAIKAARKQGLELLPSANMLDGAAKQIDDGLVAAIDLAFYRGELGMGPAVPDFVRAVFDKLPPGSPARPFLAAALELAEKPVELPAEQVDQKDFHLAVFNSNKALSKPISFYNWTPELQRVWRFYRFLQTESEDDGPFVVVHRDVAAVLGADPALLEQYRTVNGFFGRLSNPMICVSADMMIGSNETVVQLAEKHGTRRPTVAFFPPSTSRETELFDRLLNENALPPDMNLMGELIRRIRSGDVDLAPDDAAGWYQYQVYALETMLLPAKGQEKDKLLLTANYKKRLVEAFKALVTKRRETHARFGAIVASLGGPAPPAEVPVRPRLRIEPCATFYLRTARAYGFLEDLLIATVGEERLSGLHGLKKGGEREMSLAKELAAIRERFYGFYLVACEDIGMRPQFLDGEPVDEAAAKQAALAWLDTCGGDSDLARDTRVSVPIFIDLENLRTRIWATLGVRLARLNASYPYNRAPMWRPRGSDVEWQEVKAYNLEASRYVIAVDEFAEIELDGLNALTRDELRKACDKYKTKEKIVKALSRR